MRDAKVSLMTIIKASADIKAPLEKVWNIISDLDNEPKFWKGTKEVRNISKEGDIVNREITIAFRDQKCLQQVTLTPKEKIEAVFTKGIIKGTKTISLINKEDNVKLETIWDIKLSGMMGMFTGMVKKHIKSGTEEALQSIKREAER
ncbi:MAG: Cyclase/dehydrase [Nitrosopumilales archaeon]|nr:MAG: Cyclase/dehydrase [Nitrosopumilales archaeon]